jgi:hypothetical protein
VLAFFGLCYARGLLGASKFDAKVGKFSTICLKNTGYCRSQKLFFKNTTTVSEVSKKIKEEGGMVYLLTIRARSLTISDVVESRLLWACLLRHNEPGSLQSASCKHPF